VQGAAGSGAHAFASHASMHSVSLPTAAQGIAAAPRQLSAAAAEYIPCSMAPAAGMASLWHSRSAQHPFLSLLIIL
jgi:hypothetical protein